MEIPRDEKLTYFEGDVTPLTAHITTKAPGDRHRTSVYFRKPAPLRQPKHTHTHTHTHTHCCKRYRWGIHTQIHTHKHSNQQLLLTPSIAWWHRHETNTVPIHLVVWWLTHSHMTMHWFLFPSLPLFASSAGCADGALWRNPLSRHFSFPLTDRPWRARAFGPPAWLAARQLNKPSGCYNSLKHFQLPESNKSCRRAVGCFSTSNPTPQQVLLRLSFGFSVEIPHATMKGKSFSGQGKHEVSERNWRVQTARWEKGDDLKVFSKLSTFCA